MNQESTCPNCQAELKSNLMGSNSLMDEKEIKLINEYHETGAQAYCHKCGSKLLKSAKKEQEKERGQLVRKIGKLIHAVPVVSTHAPLHWDYRIIGMATGQSTTGTGAFSEFTSSIADVLGGQSGSYNKKLKAGEDMCFAQLKKGALDQGGNAVIATDIDYSEVGSGKGILMVCMAGTVIKLSNLEVLGKNVDRLAELTKYHDRLIFLEAL